MFKNKIQISLYSYMLYSLFNIHQSYAQSGIGNQVGDAGEVSNQNINILSTLINSQLIVNFAFALFVILLTFFLSKFLPHLITSRMENFLEKSGASNGEEMLGVVNRSVSVFVLFLGFSAVMSILGLDMTIFLGGLGFGIGFTLKVFLSNFIAGIMMVTQGTYHNGDLVKIGDDMGRIDRIFSLYTRVEQFDGVMYLVPNLKFLEENVSNYNLNSKRRIEIVAQVTYETDIYKAKQVLMKVASKFPNLLKAPAPKVLVTDLAENGIDLSLRVWINSSDQYFTTKSHLTETINLAFRQSGINIPYKNITITNYNNASNNESVKNNSEK